MAGGVSIIEAITILMVSIIVFYIVEVTFGTAMDQMAYYFSMVPVADAWVGTTGQILAKFGYMHKIMGILVVAMVLWVIRIVIFQHGYTRNRI
jgi:hypothetical protein